MNEAKIDAALDFLEGSPKCQKLLSRLDDLSGGNLDDENLDNDPDKSIAVISMFNDLVGQDAYKEAEWICSALDSEIDTMSEEQQSRFAALLRPHVAFAMAMDNLVRLEQESSASRTWAEGQSRVPRG